MAWAALAGGAGTAGIAFLIPLIGGTRSDLWITRAWDLLFELIALAGLVIVTRRPPAPDAIHNFRTSALLLRILAAAAVLNRIVVMMSFAVAAEDAFRMTAALCWHTIRPAAGIFAVAYVGALLLRFGLTRLGRVMQWTAAALVARWLVDYPVDAVVMASVNPDGTAGWAYSLSAMAFGAVMLLWTWACLLRSAKHFPAAARGRCVNCGYVPMLTTRCPECGARFAEE